MFESVVAKSEPPHARMPALGLSALVFVLVAALLALWPSAAVPAVRRAVEVTFAVAKPKAEAPAAAAPSPAAPARRSAARPLAKKRELAPAPAPVTAPQAVVAANPAPTGAVADSAGASSAIGAASASTSSGVPGTAATNTNSALPFGPGMTRPEQIAGNTPEYTREALAARVEGKVLVRCVITKQGAIQACQLIKGVPFLDRIALDSLARSRWKPVTYRGQAETVQYLFTFNFKLP